MRYAEFVLRPGREGFHPAEGALIADPDVERVAIYNTNQLDDGTIVFLYAFQGDRERAQAILEAEEDVLSYSLAGDEGGGDILAYIHFDPNETVATLFRLQQEYSLVVDTPIECLPDGGVRVRVLGEDATVRKAVEFIPDGVSIELETMGEYHPDDRQPFSLLTARQKEILGTAIEAGYYDQPREATYEDIAETMDLAPVTVGEHLRKIEGKLLKEVYPG